MKRTEEQVKKLVENYLKTEHIHKFPLQNIRYEFVSTYDGEYPLFIVEYNAKEMGDDGEIWNELVKGINNYTNLKRGRDYWIGLEWSWNS